MFNLLVKATGWAEGRDTMLASRLFEYTEEEIAGRFGPSEKPDFESLARLPAVFAAEHGENRSGQIVRIGFILRARMVGRDIALEYAYDPAIPALTNETLEQLSSDLGIEGWEMSRTHWAVKDQDLFRALLRLQHPRRSRPRVFNLNDPEMIERSLVSTMMPFHPSFDPVYTVLKESAEAVGLRCRRADDIWENPAVIQDVVSLIDRSKVVICDCSGRNPNVYYETGIAHTLGREVILITQTESDIPFDLRHLRYVHYLNNTEGRGKLRGIIEPRLADLAAS